MDNTSISGADRIIPQKDCGFFTKNSANRPALDRVIGTGIEDFGTFSAKRQHKFFRKSVSVTWLQNRYEGNYLARYTAVLEGWNVGKRGESVLVIQTFPHFPQVFPQAFFTDCRQEEEQKGLHNKI